MEHYFFLSIEILPERYQKKHLSKMDNICLPHKKIQKVIVTFYPTILTFHAIANLSLKSELTYHNTEKVWSVR